MSDHGTDDACSHEEHNGNDIARPAEGQAGQNSQQPSAADAEREARTTRIRELNDHLRRTSHGGMVMMTDGIAAQGPEFVFKTFDTLSNFSAFDSGNDPYNEHDFGAFTIDGERVFFKIDYYDRSRLAGSPDPADPKVTTRVLTVMLAHEY